MKNRKISSLWNYSVLCWKSFGLNKFPQGKALSPLRSSWRCDRQQEPCPCCVQWDLFWGKELRRGFRQQASSLPPLTPLSPVSQVFLVLQGAPWQFPCWPDGRSKAELWAASPGLAHLPVPLGMCSYAHTPTLCTLGVCLNAGTLFLLWKKQSSTLLKDLDQWTFYALTWKCKFTEMLSNPSHSNPNLYWSPLFYRKKGMCFLLCHAHN